MNSEKYTPVPEHLRRIAEAMNRTSLLDPAAMPKYHFLSGAVVWPDELPSEAVNNSAEFYPVRYLWNHRSMLTMSMTSEYAAWWEHALRYFPNWVGFRDERRLLTPEFVKEFERGKHQTEEFLRAIARFCPSIRDEARDQGDTVNGSKLPS